MIKAVSDMYNHFNHYRPRKHIIQMWVLLYIIHNVRQPGCTVYCTAKPRYAVFSRHSSSHIESTVSTKLSPSMILGVLK